MPNEIRTKRDTSVSFTITLSLIPDGVAHQSDMTTNTNDRGAMIAHLILTSSAATAPTAGSTHEIFGLRGDGGSYRSDGAGASAAVIVIENAQMFGTIVVTATTDKPFYGDFDSAPLGPLDEEFGIAVRNGSGAATDNSATAHLADYELYLPEIQ